MPTLTARGAGEEHAGMKLIIPSNELNDKTSGGGVAYNGKHKTRL